MIPTYICICIYIYIFEPQGHIHIYIQRERETGGYNIHACIQIYIYIHTHPQTVLCFQLAVGTWLMGNKWLQLDRYIHMYVSIHLFLCICTYISLSLSLCTRSTRNSVQHGDICIYIYHYDKKGPIINPKAQNTPKIRWPNIALIWIHIPFKGSL